MVDSDSMNPQYTTPGVSSGAHPVHDGSRDDESQTKKYNEEATFITQSSVTQSNVSPSRYEEDCSATKDSLSSTGAGTLDDGLVSGTAVVSVRELRQRSSGMYRQLALRVNLGYHVKKTNRRAWDEDEYKGMLPTPEARRRLLQQYPDHIKASPRGGKADMLRDRFKRRFHPNEIEFDPNSQTWNFIAANPDVS
jgi:hypothetical protein